MELAPDVRRRRHVCLYADNRIGFGAGAVSVASGPRVSSGGVRYGRSLLGTIGAGTLCGASPSRRGERRRKRRLAGER